MSLYERLKTFSKFQITLELMTLAINIGTGIFLIVIWGSLPDKIPTHFNALGEADGYGSPSNLIFIFVMMFVLCLMIFAITLFPNIWNMPGKITENNSNKAYSYMRSMLCCLSLILALTFSYMTIMSALQKSLGIWFTAVSLILTFGDIIFFIVKTVRLPK